jgi:hypothetical protein
MPLADWEKRFALSLREILKDQRGKAGAMLPVIPSRDEWDQFVAEVRNEWWHWEWIFTLNPGCLVVLYDGVAFYNYRSGAFWDGFAEVVGASPIPVNVQTAINRSFTNSAKRFELRVAPGNFVGSAVAHIGIPISMWDGFLHVCEWALWTDGWDDCADNTWRDAISRRLGGQARLIRFLIDNRDAATQFVTEMLDARRVLSADRTLTVSGIAQALILRVEYFDEVPETADFLRPDDPESLFSDRANLAWNEERQTISLHLPPVDSKSLPARWCCNGCVQPATDTATELAINSIAFTTTLRLELQSKNGPACQRIAAIDEWAIYDELRKRFVNRGRDLLPVSTYTLISLQPLKPNLGYGWSQDPEDPAIDLAHELADGTRIYLSRLFPESRRPKLQIGDGPWIHFAQRRNVALRVFCGDKPRNAARFSILPTGMIRTETWPRPFLEVPLSLVRDDDIPSEFIVWLDGKRACGKWKLYEFDPPDVEEEKAERAFYFWQWDEQPIPPPPTQTTIHRSFSALDNNVIQPRVLNWTGEHTLHVESRRLGRLSFGAEQECKFELVQPTPDHLWPNNWGDYMACVLLAQVQDEATWEEVRFAREATAMWTDINLNAVYYQIRKLEQHGFLVVRGHRYLDFHSRITLTNFQHNSFRGEFCGLSSKLYDLTRIVQPLKIAVAPSERGYPAKLHIDWHHDKRHAVRDACANLKIENVQRLW